MLYILKRFKGELKEKKFVVLKVVEDIKKLTFGKVETFLNCLVRSYDCHEHQIIHLKSGYCGCLH